MVRIHNGILFSHKKKKNPTICSNMDGARGYYAQRNKPVGERQVPNDFTHMWSKRTKKNLKEKNSNRITEPKNGLTVPKGKGLGRMGGKGGIRSGKRKGTLQLACIM